jgi:hypothetical protein
MRWRAATVATLAVGLTGWWLFGFSRESEGPLTTTMYRRFGRVTRSDMSDRSRNDRMRVIYSWSEPYEQGDPITSCAAVLPETWQDWNADGRWDTWTYRVGPDRAGECSVEYRVDLNGDERSDWRFVSAFHSSDRARQRIVDHRGF